MMIRKGAESMFTEEDNKENCPSNNSSSYNLRASTTHQHQRVPPQLGLSFQLNPSKNTITA